MDSHPDYGLVHTDFDKLRVGKGELFPHWQQSRKKKIPEGRVYEELLQATFIATCTVCARRELVQRWQNDAGLSDMRFIQGDYAKWLFIACHSKIGYLPISTETKRELPESVSHPKSPQKKYDYYMCLHEIKKTYMAHYPCSQETEKRITLNFHKHRLRLAYISQNFQSAKESYLFLCRHTPPSFKNTFYFVACFIKSRKRYQ